MGESVTTGRLNRVQRQHAVDELGRGIVDVLVVGGGVVGAGAALDAASRGLTVGLVERDDWGSGTSSRSSRLAHGGLRYLEQREFGLVHEALTERGLLLERIAPHLVRPVRFVFPLSTQWERPYVGAGVALYDALARFGIRVGTLPGHRHLSKRATMRLVPGLDEAAFSGAVTFFDAQIDDARHTLATVRTAAAHGAHVVSRCAAVGLLEADGQVTGVQAEDRTTGQRFDIRARVVICALGVWAESIDGWLAGDKEQLSETTPMAPSKGVHLVVHRRGIDSHTALITRTESSVLFCLPWGNHWLVGTTDTPWLQSVDAFGDGAIDQSDVAYLVSQVNRWFAKSLNENDIVGYYSGLRPLISDDDATADTTKVSREHVVANPRPGLISVSGGKYTTYRVMAADAVDLAVTQLPTEMLVGASRTKGIPVVGADYFHQLWDQRDDFDAPPGLSAQMYSRLLRRHGDQVSEILALLVSSAELATPISGSRYLTVEVTHAIDAEGAMTLADFMLRRSRLGQELPHGGESAIAQVASLMADGLGWSTEQQAAELDAYRTHAVHVS